MHGILHLEPFDIAHSIDFSKGLSIPIDSIPRQHIDGKIRIGKKVRCEIRYGLLENKGGHGNISKVVRSPGPQTLCVKSPHNPSYSLLPEAVVQLYASESLRAAGIVGAIPHIYDIFQYAGETRFSMDFIEGKSAVEAVKTSSEPDKTWLQILAQVSLLLGYLEETIHLDHRDLKADNLWIRNTPIEYYLTVEGVRWHLKAPFQVVILDFGFGCIGDTSGNAIISLSDGILPKIDPCPKEGRDLFQLLASMWSIPTIRARASTEVQDAMDALLVHKNGSYETLVKKTTTTHWIYWAVSDRKFRHPLLHPATLLVKLSEEWKETDLYRE